MGTLPFALTVQETTMAKTAFLGIETEFSRVTPDSFWGTMYVDIFDP